MLHANDLDLIGQQAIEHSVAETPKRDAAHVVEDHLIYFGIRAKALDRFLQAPEKGVTQTRSEPVIPARGSQDVPFCFL